MCFRDEHQLDLYGDHIVGRFDANPRMAEAWQRLADGNPHLPRRQWHELPPEARAEVQLRTGPVLRATPVEAGSISDFATVLETRDGRFFCKGAAEANPMGWMHRNEARINPYLPAQMPRLQWQVEADGWLVLGFEYVEGRHPDLSPGSPDLPAVAATLGAMAGSLTPCPVPKVQAATVRWADRVMPEAVDGQTLVHTDVTPHNFLIHGGGVTVVDWSTGRCRAGEQSGSTPPS